MSSLEEDAAQLREEMEAYVQITNPYKKVIASKRIRDKFGLDQSDMKKLEEILKFENDPRNRMYTIREILEEMYPDFFFNLDT